MSDATRRQTGSQTAGPYVSMGLVPSEAGITGIPDLATHPFPDDEPGERLEVELRVVDGNDEPVTDALIEVWQADGEGRFAGQRGFGRYLVSSPSGSCVVRTVRPGRVAAGDGRLQAPHLTLLVMARGINVGLRTRVYLPAPESWLDEDPILQLVPTDRRGTLLAEPVSEGRCRFRVVLQGPDETVFFDVDPGEGGSS